MQKKRTLSAKEKEEARNAIARVLSARANVLFAYLFGSFVSEQVFRDIDVGVFVTGPKDIASLALEMEMEAELGEAVHLSVDVRIVNHAPLSFVYNVLKGGVVIVDKDSSRRADFEGLIYKEYFDFRHLRKEYLREIAHAPV